MSFLLPLPYLQDQRDLGIQKKRSSVEVVWIDLLFFHGPLSNNLHGFRFQVVLKLFVPFKNQIAVKL